MTTPRCNEQVARPPVLATVAVANRDKSGRVYVTFDIDAVVTLDDGQVVEVRRSVAVRATRQTRRPKRLKHARI